MTVTAASTTPHLRARDSAVLSLGLGLGSAAWLLLVVALLLRGRSLPWFSLSYNIPITLAFGAMATHAMAAALRLGPRRFVATHAGMITAWTLGALVLYLRLVDRSIDVSGHMSWGVLLCAQCHI